MAPPPGISHVSRCHLFPHRARFAGRFPKTSSPAAKALGVVKKGYFFFHRAEGKAVGSHTSPGVGVLALRQNDSERGWAAQNSPAGGLAAAA